MKASCGHSLHLWRDDTTILPETPLRDFPKTENAIELKWLTKIYGDAFLSTSDNKGQSKIANRKIDNGRIALRAMNAMTALPCTIRTAQPSNVITVTVGRKLTQ